MAYNRGKILPRFIVLDYEDGTEKRIDMVGTREQARKKARQRAKFYKCNAYVYYCETDSVHVDYIVPKDGGETYGEGN